MLFQPTNVSPEQLNGTGAVDVTAGITVSWQVNGDSPMVAYKIDIFQNNAASTAVWSTGRVSLSVPFWGTDYAGNVQLFSADLSAGSLIGAGMSNGLEYKLSITQWWSDTDSVQQWASSVFVTRDAPTLAINTIPDPVTSRLYSFTADYLQAQGDALAWVRWRLSEAGNESRPFLDTGPIYGTGQLRVDYDGLLNDTDYVVRCDIETATGQAADTGWVSFRVSYSVSAAAGAVSACMLSGSPCVWVRWDRVEAADGYTVMRRTQNESRLVKIADVPPTSGQVRDYSAASGNTYTYYVFPTGALEYLTEPMISGPVAVQYWFWAVIEAQAVDDTGKNFSAVAAHIFRYQVSEGTISNNNSPSISANFTRYPTWQGTTANYLSGSVSGYIGTIASARSGYSDTVAQSDALFSLSNTKNALFLSDPKGHFLRIRISSAISNSIDHSKKEMPQSVTLNWVEVSAADGLHVIMYPGGDFYPVDRVIQTAFRIDVNTGALLWSRPDNYSGTGSRIWLANGAMMQNSDGPFNPAALTLNRETGEVTATLGG